MPLIDEYSIWVQGLPRSAQGGLTRGYRERVQAAARAVFASPLRSNGIEIVVLFVDAGGQRPDVDNALKLAMDAMKGIVYVDDRQVRSARAEAVPKDLSPPSDHLTFAKLLEGREFLIRVRVRGIPTIAAELPSS
jgi:hypothetical protein